MELRHRARAGDRPLPDVAPLDDEGRRPRRTHLLLRALGALAVLAVGAVHLDQYVAVHYDVVPVIGPLFLLNVIGAAAIGLLLLLPIERLAGHLFVTVLALGAIGLATTSFVFLFVSESTTLFGFREHGYRTAIVVALAAEAATAVLLGAYLAARRRRS